MRGEWITATYLPLQLHNRAYLSVGSECPAL